MSFWAPAGLGTSPAPSGGTRLTAWCWGQDQPSWQGTAPVQGKIMENHRACIRRLNRSPCCVTVKGNMKVVPSSKFSRGWHKIHRIVVLGWWKKCNYTVLITLTKHPIHWGGFRKEWSSKPLSMNTPGFLQIRCIHMHTRDKLTTWDEMIMVFKTNYSICCLYLKLKGATGGWFPALIFVLKSYSVDL